MKTTSIAVFQIDLLLGGMLTAIFAGWFMTRDAARSELGIRHDSAFAVWRFLIRCVAPAAIALSSRSSVKAADVLHQRPTPSLSLS